MKTITLANLHRATRQEVFDQVAHHLLTQMERSENEDHKCCYRSPEGLKCAAGALIADKEYDEDRMGTTTWFALVEGKIVPKKHAGFIDKLQMIHDTTDPEDWREELKAQARASKLEWRFGE